MSEVVTYTKLQKELISHIIADVSALYAFSGELIPLETLSEKFEIPDAELRQLLPEINKKLELRKFPVYRPKTLVPNKTIAAEYEPLFILACEKILDPNSSKSFAGRIKELEPLGITSKSWDNWMKIPKYFNYARKQMDEHMDKQVDLNADLALARNVSQGDLQSIKFYKELSGKFRPQSENQLALMTIMNIFFEIVSKHLPANVIDTVAEELEKSPIGELMR